MNWFVNIYGHRVKKSSHSGWSSWFIKRDESYGPFPTPESAMTWAHYKGIDTFPRFKVEHFNPAKGPLIAVNLSDVGNCKPDGIQVENGGL